MLLIKVKKIFLQVIHQKVYLSQLTMYEHNGVSESTDFDYTNFSSVGLAE